MTLYHLERETDLGCALEDLFRFFADARNLEEITPPWLHFEILSPLPIEMRVGALIRYRLRLHGIPVRWTTKITAWDPPGRFVDEQISGPFRKWIHEHTFEKSANGTLVRDVLRYAVPGGALVNRLFVRRDLERVFDYREERLRELVGCPQSGAAPDPSREGTKVMLDGAAIPGDLRVPVSAARDQPDANRARSCDR